MDNASAQIAIALQLRDLDELESLGTIDQQVIHLQRQQLETDSGFDAVTFEASRRLALSMAKAVEEDSLLLAQSTNLPPIDDTTFDRLAILNHPPSIPIERTGLKMQSAQTSPLQASHQKRARSSTPEDEALPASISELPHKKIKSQHMTSVECVSCSETLTDERLIKASCNHDYCKECFSRFIAASLQTQDGFPASCCKIPLAFITIAENVSAEIFASYSARQDEVKNATALYCGIQSCGVKIEEERIDENRATCAVCRRDTCTLCRIEYPREVDGANVGHVCKKDLAREQLVALAKEEGWQTCYQCGNLVALNYGCHHMHCRCNAEFCYRCGTKWRNCDCGDYDQPRLEARAVMGIEIRARRRIARGLSPDSRPLEEQQAELQQRLQVDCDHNNFLKDNPGHCQICDYDGWKYILRCDTCGFTACQRCHTFFDLKGDEDLADILIGQFHDDETDDEIDNNTDNEPATEDETV